MGFKTVKDAKTNSSEIDGLSGTAALNHSVQEDFYLVCDALAVLNERKKGDGPGGTCRRGRDQHHISSIAPGKAFKAAVSAQRFLGCWAWASLCLVSRTGGRFISVLRAWFSPAHPVSWRKKSPETGRYAFIFACLRG